MTKIIVFGATGMLGNYIFSYLSIDPAHLVVKITRDMYDAAVDNYTKLEDLLVKFKIDKFTYIINCIGIIPQASKNYKLSDRLYIKINTLFPNMLSNICVKYGAVLIHPTTDCVYDGKLGNYNESSEPTETNIYGITKSLGEPNNCMVIRTSIIGEELNNKRSLLEWIKSNKNGEINGYINHWWNGITCLEFAKLVNQIIKDNISWVGVRHIFSPRPINKYNLAQLINKIYGLNIKINKFETETINKTLSSIYEPIFSIPTLDVQIEEMYEFGMIYFNKSTDELKKDGGQS